MNRRDFLRDSSLVAGSSAAITAKSYAAILGANDRVSLGIVGLGRRGSIVANAFVKDPRVQIVALSDVYGEQTRLFQQRFAAALSQPAVSIAYQDLLANKAVDSVLIATPDHLHVDIACAALAAGKHIYLEKPTVHRWPDRTRLQQAAAQSKRVLQCGMQQRSGAHYARAKQEFFDSGKLGQVILVRAVWHNFPWQRRDLPDQPKPADLDWNRFLGPAPKVPYQYARYTSWRSFPDYGAGVLADILTHWVDVAQWFLADDQPQHAVSLGGEYQVHGYFQNPDTVSAIIQYRKWNLNFESSILALRDDHPSVYFQGTEGLLNITREGYTYSPNHGDPVVFKSDQDLEVAHTGNFLDAVVSGRAVSAPLSTGLAATLPVELALHSYWNHKIAVPADLT